MSIRCRVITLLVKNSLICFYVWSKASLPYTDTTQFLFSSQVVFHQLHALKLYLKDNVTDYGVKSAIINICNADIQIN